MNASTLNEAIILPAVWAGLLAWYDLRQRRLPNGLTLGAAAFAIVFLLVSGRSPLGAGPVSAWTAGIGAFVLLSPLCRAGWLGAGDVKLMAAIGLIGGLNVLLLTFVFSSLLTLPAALWVFCRDRYRGRPASASGRLPQGVFIGLGLMLALLGGAPV